MITFNIFYCIFIIAFAVIIVYVYKKYKQPVIKLINTINNLYELLIRLKVANEAFNIQICDNIDKLLKNDNTIINEINTIKTIVTTTTKAKSNKAKNSSNKSKKNNNITKDK